MIYKPTILNRETNFLHKTLVICDIMPSEKHRSQHFSGSKEMMEIGSTMFCASRTRASSIERTRIGSEARIPKIVDAGGGICPRGTTRSCRNHAIEHVDTTLDRAEDVIRCPNAHQIPRRCFWKMGDSRVERLQHRSLSFSDGQS